MVEVRIREEYDTSAVRLGEVAFDEAALDRVIPLLCHERGDMLGQFKVSDSGAYFEVVLTGPDD